jgi:hypothetical protein
MMPVTKFIALWVVLVGFAGAAFAQPGPGSAATAAGSGAAGGSGTAAVVGEPPPPAPPPGAPAAPDARKMCTAAMNADPQFAAAIIKVADEKAAAQRDADTIAAHKDANYHVQKNERHVIYAYAAMWIVAALSVIFLWRRQQGLQAEIVSLRRELEAAADGSGATPGATKERS